MGFKKPCLEACMVSLISQRRSLGQEHSRLALSSAQAAVDHQRIMRLAKSQDGASGSTTQGQEESRIHGQVG